MADGIITPCNVARSWQWFRQVIAPCNVACGSGIMTVNSPSGSTLQCGRWLWDDMPWNSPKRPTYWNSTIYIGFRFWPYDRSRHVILHQYAKLYQNRTTLSRKNMTSCRFSRRRISAIFDFRGPIMGSLKSPCRTSYRSSVETMTLNCLVFEKITFLHFGDRQTNRWTALMH